MKGYPLHNSPYGLCGRKAALKIKEYYGPCGLCGRKATPKIKEYYGPCGLCGRKATLKKYYGR